MHAVRRQIQEVIDQIGSRRDHAEKHKCRECPSNRHWVKKLLSEDEGKQNQQVLRPLMQTECIGPWSCSGPRSLECAIDFDSGQTPPLCRCTGMTNDMGHPCFFPNENVRGRVAYVVEGVS